VVVCVFLNTVLTLSLCYRLFPPSPLSPHKQLAPIAGGPAPTSAAAVGSGINMIRGLQQNRQQTQDNPSEINNFNATTDSRMSNSRGTGHGQGFSRTFNTMSAAEKWDAQQRRGGPSVSTFTIQPQHIDIGDLSEGAVYRTTLVLRNASQATGRFRLGRRGRPSEDPEDEGLSEPGCDSKSHRVRVVYRPGPLAPGIKRTLEVEIAAMTPVPAGSSSTTVEDFVEVVGEDQIVRVPLRGRVVAATKHDQRRVGKSMRLVSKS
jgi:hypothetical protein